MNPIVILHICNGVFYRAFAGLLAVALGLGFLANGKRWHAQAPLDSNADRLHLLPIHP